MSNYNDFLNVVNALSLGTIFEITYDWCKNKGLTLIPNTAKSWGKKFAKEYQTYKVKCVACGTDKHHQYEKL